MTTSYPVKVYLNIKKLNVPRTNPFSSLTVATSKIYKSDRVNMCSKIALNNLYSINITKQHGDLVCEAYSMIRIT